MGSCSKPDSLEAEGLTSGGGDRGLDVLGAEQLVLVGDGLQSAGLDGVAALAEVDVVDNCVANSLGVSGLDGLLNAREDSGLDQQLGADTGVDTSGGVLSVVVVDVAGTEAERGATRVDVGEVVVGVGDDQVAGVLIGVGVAVADERGLPVVVQVAVADGDVVRAVGDVEKTVVVVLVVVHVGRQVKVVEPDVAGGLDGEGVAGISEDLADLDVADDDVGRLLDAKADTLQGGTSRSNDGLVRGDVDLVGASNDTVDDDDGGALGLSSGLELLQRGDGGLLTIGTTGGTAVLRGVTDVAGLGHGSGDGGGVAGARLDNAEGGGRGGRGHEAGDKSELHFESV